MHPLIIWFLILVSPSPGTPRVTQSPTELAGPCGLDAHEDNSRRAKAKPLGDAGVEAVICAADEDWFSFDLAKGQRVELVAKSPGARHLQLSLYPPRARKARGRRRATSGGRIVQYRARRTGKHRIRIRTRSESPLPYQLLIRAR